jgi:hypothetical protein
MKASFLNKLLLLINRSYTMKKLVLLVILAFSLVLSPLATTMASTPKLINYQGKLKNLPAQSGPFLVVFEIFEDAAGGTALWIEQKNVTPSADGTFSTYLGETNPIDLKFDKQYYVQVTVGNNQPFPRTKLTSAPSAFHAIDADTAQHAFTADMANGVVPNVLTWDNMTADAQMAGGVLMGTYPNPQIRPDAILDNIPDGSITTEMLSPNISTSPSGPAGGDLTGTYPDPLIAVGAVKTDRIADGAVTNEKIANLTIADAKIVDLDAAKLFNLGALSGTVAVMTDATIDGDGTNAMPLGLADSAVTSVKIADGEVMTQDLMDDAVTNEKLADDAVMSANIMDGEVMNADLADDAVMSNNIMDGEVMTADIMDAAVTNAKLAVDAVRMENIDVNGGAPTDGEFLSWDDVDGEMRWVEPTVVTSAPLTGNGQTATPVTLDPTFGNVNELLIRDAAGWTSGLINSANIAAGAVTSTELADDAVMTNHIMDGQVMTADLMDGAVNSAKILDESIATIDLMDGSVTEVKIADDAVTTGKILDGTIINADLADGAVTSAKILDGEVMTADLMDAAVTTVKIADASVTEPKMADNSVSTRTILDLAVTNGKLAADAVTTDKILDGTILTEDLADLSVTEPKLADAAVSTRTIVDNAIVNSKIADLAVTNEKVSSQNQPQGKIMKSDGNGGVSWEDDEGIVLPWTGSYDGPGDAFTLTHTGIAGDGSAAVFNSTDAGNADPTVEIIKDVSNGAGSALAVHGIGVEGANYIATFTNNNLNEGRTVLIQNEAPATSNGGTLFDPGTPADPADDYVNPDQGNPATDVQDAALVVNNTDPSASGQKLAIKTYGSIQANSAIQGADLISHNGEVIVYDGNDAGATLFINEGSMEKTDAASETFRMFNDNGDFDVDLDGHIDVRNQAFIGDNNDENQTTVRGAVTAVAIDLSVPGVPNVSPAGPGTASTVATANADLLVDGDAELSGSLNLGGGADTYNSVNDIYISTDLTTLTPPLPAPPTTVIFESNDAQLISARAVEDALLNHDLQVAYNNGNSITSTDAQGDIDFNLEEATDFTITGANVGNDVIIDGAGYLDAQVNIINRAPGTAVIVEDDLEPQADNTFDLGSDANRWQDVYVNGTSVHVGPANGQAGGTELAVGYAANAATFTVDAGVMQTLDAGNDAATFDTDSDANNELIIDPAGNISVGGILLDGNDDGTQNFHVNGTVALTDGNGDGNNDVIVDPTGALGTAGVLLDGNSDGTPNIHTNGVVVLNDANGDATNDVIVDPTGALGTAGILLDGNSDGTQNFHVNGTVALTDGNGDGTNDVIVDPTGALGTVGTLIDGNSDGNTNLTVNGTLVNTDANGDGNNDVSVDPTGAGYVVDGNSSGTANLTVTGGVVNVDANDDGANNITANGVLANIDANGDGNNDLSVDPTGAGVVVDGNSDGNANITATGVLVNTDANGDGNNDVSVDPTGAGYVVDGNSSGTANLTVTGGVVNIDANDDGANNITANGVLANIDADGDGNNDVAVDPTGAGVVVDGNSDGAANLTVTGAVVNVDANGDGANNIVANGVLANIDADGDGNNDLTVDPTGTGVSVDGNSDGAANFNVNGANVTIDPAGDGTNNYTFAEASLTIDNDNGGAATDVTLTETGLNRNGGAVEAFAFANTGGVLDVDISGNVDVASANSTFGDNTDATQATVNGAITALAAAPSVAPVAGAAQDLIVNGDAQITGSLTLSDNSVNDIYNSTDNLVGPPLVMDPAATDRQLVTALAVQQALINHDLQVAYNNGNAIVAVDAEGDIDFDMTENTDFTVNLATANNNVVVDGLGIIDAQVDIENSVTGTVIVDDNLDVRDALFNNSVDATPLAINDDVTITMQDNNDNVEITDGGTGTVGNLLDITKTGADAAFAVEVNTNQSGIDVVTTNNNAVAYSTTLAGSNAVGYTVSTTGSDARNITSSSTGANAIDVSATASGNTATAIQGTATGGAGVAVRATAAGGNAVISSNASTGVANSTVTVDNTTAAATSFAVTVENGNMKLSHDNAVTAANLPAAGGTINPTSQTIVRATTLGGANAGTVTLAAATTEGQVIIITNENPGNISITGGVAATYVIPGNEAAQFVYVNGLWYKMN